MTAFAASAQTVCSRSARDHACCASITTTRWLPQGMCDGVVAASAQTADSLSWRMERLAYRTRRGCGEPRRRRRGGGLGACVRVLRLRHACINSLFTPREASSFCTLTLKPRNKVSHERACVCAYCDPYAPMSAPSYTCEGGHHARANICTQRQSYIRA